jgi:hypothetical protein
LAASFWLELEAPASAAVTVAILAAPTRGSFVQNNQSTDCDAGRRHAGRRCEQMSQKPTFVPKGADLYQTAAMRSGSVTWALLSGPVSDGGLEGSASARGKCSTPSPFLSVIRGQQGRGLFFLKQASNRTADN